ncbi:hypothetical protein WH47_09246 [Habropoda laboriosa]|uniref:DUF4219 domain-containing protein n=1 Tax=Habropoda laboriosa TaxID=597456 RepID=A0A0L7R8Z9_9HYME|nr:hypothetical protein WH47_09246 [Habropoda laboriosa]
MAIYNGNIVRTDILTKDNYDAWCIHAEALLMKNDVWGYATGSIKRSIERPEDPASVEAARAWDIADKKEKADLILSIGLSQLKLITGC